MEKTYGDGSYCSNVELLPSDLNLTLPSFHSNKSGSKAKSTYWFNGKKKNHFDSSESGSLEEDQTQIRRSLILKIIFGQFLRRITQLYKDNICFL